MLNKMLANAHKQGIHSLDMDVFDASTRLRELTKQDTDKETVVDRTNHPHH